MTTISDGLISNGNGPSLSYRSSNNKSVESDKKIDCIQSNGVFAFFIPNIKLVGYGNSQTYQVVCLKCGVLFFCLNRNKEMHDLFCDSCTPEEEYLKEENLSPINFVGNILGWEVKSSNPLKKKSFYNYKKVYVRDKYTCQYCGYSLKTSSEFRSLHIDHVIHRRGVGNNKMENLVVSCELCNNNICDKWFTSFYDKKMYLMSKLKKN